MIIGLLHLELVIILYPLLFNSTEDFDFLLVFLFNFFDDIFLYIHCFLYNIFSYFG